MGLIIERFNGFPIPFLSLAFVSSLLLLRKLFQGFLIGFDVVFHADLRAKFSDEVIGDVLRIPEPDAAFSHIELSGYPFGIFLHEPGFDI